MSFLRTFIAFRIESDFDDEKLEEGVERVRKHYYKSITDDIKWTEKIVRHKNLGAIIFDLEDSPLRWANTYETDDLSLITYAPPSNWKNYCKTGDVKTAPKELLSFIKENNDEKIDFSAPTCFSIIDKINDKLEIYTDSIGFTRLYEYRGKNGWFWSNRAGVLPLMAGEKAEVNKDGWASLCAAGWFIGNTSPIDKVTRISQGIKIKITADSEQPRKHIDNGAFSDIVSPRKSSELNYRLIAEDMKSNLESYRELWGLPLNVDLSGGKDSRVCAAAVISSGVKDVEFRTVANYDDEVQVARELLQKVDPNYKHIVEDRTSKETDGKLVKKSLEERMKLYFHSTDGDCTPAIIQNDVFDKTIYKYGSKVRVAGALGEAAKPVYYNSEKRVKKLNLLKNEAAFQRIKDTYFKYPAVLSNIQDRSANIIYSALQKGKSYGLNNLQLLDYFYIAERGRRWPPQSNDIGKYSIFFSNVFFSQTMNMTIEERINNEFFTNINKYFLPEWGDVRFFQKTDDKDERSEKKMRLWQTSDREGIEKILNEPKKWNEFFDE